MKGWRLNLRVYALLGLFVGLAALIVHQVAKVSWVVAGLVALGGMFANGILIMLGNFAHSVLEIGIHPAGRVEPSLRSSR